MRVALAMLCIVAATVFLRFLGALMKEARSQPAPSGHRGKLVEMNTVVEKRKVSSRTA
jgi:hypothetical protein